MRILAIGDIHEPFSHKDSFEFIKTIHKKFKPDQVVYMGDEVDHHSFSFHEKEVDVAFSPAEELEKAIDSIQKWYELTPKALICESNHGSLVYRKAKHHGMPRSVFKTYNELLKTPKWIWKDRIKLGNILFMHQINSNALNAARIIGMSVVQGHAHTKMLIEYFNSEFISGFSAFSGSLIDRDAYAFSYAKSNILKPALGSLLIENGIPRIIPMNVDKNNRWVDDI